MIWSWGGGNLGIKDDVLSDLPRKIAENTENRRFTDIFANANSAAFFARILSALFIALLLIK